jgi:secreted trypsin-like serine protease
VKGGEYKLGVDDEPRTFQIVPVKKITMHPEYFTGSLQNDIAVLHMAENFRTSENIAPLCIPDKPETEQNLYGNSEYKCITTGWGKQVLQGKKIFVLYYSET